MPHHKRIATQNLICLQIHNPAVAAIAELVCDRLIFGRIILQQRLLQIEQNPLQLPVRLIPVKQSPDLLFYLIHVRILLVKKGRQIPVKPILLRCAQPILVLRHALKQVDRLLLLSVRKVKLYQEQLCKRIISAGAFIHADRLRGTLHPVGQGYLFQPEADIELLQLFLHHIADMTLAAQPRLRMLFCRHLNTQLLVRCGQHDFPIVFSGMHAVIINNKIQLTGASRKGIRRHRLALRTEKFRIRLCRNLLKPPLASRNLQPFPNGLTHILQYNALAVDRNFDRILVSRPGQKFFHRLIAEIRHSQRIVECKKLRLLYTQHIAIAPTDKAAVRPREILLCQRSQILWMRKRKCPCLILLLLLSDQRIGNRIFSPV